MIPSDAARAALGATALHVAANVASALIPFILLPILTRVLTPADYGVVSLFSVLLASLCAVVGLNSHGSVEPEYFRLPAPDFARLVTACLVIAACTAAATALVLHAAARPLYLATGVPEPWLYAALLASLAQFVISLRMSVWLIERSTARYAAMQVLQGLAGVALSLVLVLSFGLQWQGRVGAMVSILLVFGCWALASLAVSGHVARQVDAAQLRSALAYGAPLVPHVVGGLLIAATDQVIVKHFLGLAEAGSFAVSLQIGSVVQLLTLAANRAFVPWLYRNLGEMDQAGRSRLVRRTYVAFGALAAGAALYGWLAPWLFGPFVGKAFTIHPGVVAVIALGYAFGGMYFGVTNYVFFAGATGRLSLVTLSSGLFNVAATWLLVGRYGLAGAGLGFLSSQAFLFLATWWLAHRVHPMPWRQALGRASGS